MAVSFCFLCCAVVQGPDGLRSIPNINTTVTFNPGEFQMNIDVILNDDNVALEPQEMYTVTLSIETGMDLARLSAPDSAVINVLDDDRKLKGKVLYLMRYSA